MKHHGKNSSIFQRRVWMFLIILIMIAGFLFFRYLTGNLDPLNAGIGAEALSSTSGVESEQRMKEQHKIMSAAKKWRKI